MLQTTADHILNTHTSLARHWPPAELLLPTHSHTVSEVCYIHASTSMNKVEAPCSYLLCAVAVHTSSRLLV